MIGYPQTILSLCLGITSWRAKSAFGIIELCNVQANIAVSVAEESENRIGDQKIENRLTSISNTCSILLQQIE